MPNPEERKNFETGGHDDNQEELTANEQEKDEELLWLDK